jgi:uncharacterized protein
MAAEQNVDLAQLAIGDMYRTGEGVAQDFVEAMRWYRMAAEQNDDMAQYEIGDMYRTGEGVGQDFVEAMRWYRMAADHGNSVAQWDWAKRYASSMNRIPSSASSMRLAVLSAVSPR